jgi:GT2 family glycosyltransferase
VVVDNASTDGAPDLAERRGALVLRSPRNEGFAHAVNRGIRECSTPYVAILNSDVELDASWLEALLSAAAADVWFATGKTFRAGSRDILDGTFDLVCRGGCAWRAGSGRRVSAAYDSVQTIALASMTASLFRRDLFDHAGWLDERFESYLEDVDFGLRCAAQARSGRYVPEAVAWHEGSASIGPWHNDTVRRIARNQIFLVAQHGGQWNWPVLVAQLLWGFVAARHGGFRAWLEGKYEGWARRHEFEAKPVPAAVWLESERQLYELQARDGMDMYWRLYFLLTRKVR